MAEAVFQYLVNQANLQAKFEIASAATSTWEVGEPPHPGTRLILRNHSIPISSQKRAVQISPHDYTHYDYILAMDSENLSALRRDRKVRRLMDFASPQFSRDVPDPYYTGDFDTVFVMVSDACTGLLAHICQEANL
jgi:protein-tyrosine phosphatase